MQDRALGAKIVLALLLALALAATTARAQQGTITLAEYRERLAAALTSLDDGATPADALPTLPPVGMYAGETVAPAPLFGPEIDPQVARDRLATAIAQSDLSVDDNSAARLAQLDKVAARLDLLQPSLWERFVRWLAEWLERLLPERTPLAGGVLGHAAANLVGWVAVVTGGLFLSLLLSYWLRRLLAGMLAGQEQGRAGNGAEELPATASEARQQASQMAESGRYREAVRRLYLAALLRMTERGMLRFDSSLTNWEVLDRVDISTPARAHLTPVVETFDRVWYGEREPDASTFHAYSQEIDALLREEKEPAHG